MIIIFTMIGLVILALIFASSSSRVINTLSILHPLLYLILSIYALLSIKLPAYYLENNYFFIDYLGLYFVIITAIIFFLGGLYSMGYIDSLIKTKELNPKNTKLFFVAFNLLLISSTMAFFSNNLALLWIFLELTTLLSAVLIVTLNAKENIVAALKYVFITSTAMLFSFIGLVILFAASKSSIASGTLNWNLLMANAQQIPPHLFAVAFIFIFIGFAAKSGITPFNAWLPPAHSKAPSVVSVLLAGSVLTLGIYGILRVFAIGHQTDASSFISKMLIIFGLLSIAVAAFSIIPRNNIKKTIAFSSIENIGLMLIGIGIGTPIAIFWVLFHLLAHSMIKALLFFSAGIINRQYHSSRLDSIKELLTFQPLASWGLIIGSAAIIGTPLFPLFFSKFFIISEIGKASLILLGVVLLFLFIVAGSFIYFFIKLFTSDNFIESKIKNLEQYNVPLSMKLCIVIVLIIIMSLGLFFPEFLRILLIKIVEQLGF